MMNPLNTLAKEQWKTIGVKSHHGINIPLFSLHSKKSGGIGEYLDLLPIIDWCSSLGLSVIQLLPLNDLGLDNSPYNALSASALNPLHLSLNSLSSSGGQLLQLQKLSETPQVDYKAISSLRENFLRDYYQAVGKERMTSFDFLGFLSKNPWVEPYALFKAIKISRNWDSWQSWEANSYQDLLQTHKEEIDYQKFVQYLCYEQLSQVKKRAEQKGILLKGDIPILINLESVDVWKYRHLFNLDFAAGAPPDMYSQEGQKWGFPIFNWKAMEETNFSWWKERLKNASQYYHLFRLDHVVGFFRIWAIPKEEKAIQGHFQPEKKEEWLSQGKKIMEMILSSCPMLPIGEDLGSVPDEVRNTLSAFGICGTKVIRWERKWNEDKRYIPYPEYPTLSMTCVSTHDSDTLSQWWKNNPEEAKVFSDFKGWSLNSTLTPDHHRQILYDSHHTPSLFHINLLNEYLALIPNLASPLDERINTPGTLSNNNWTYRFRPSVEEIISNNSLAQLIKDVIS